ncbi:hypothetical protein E2562_007717 [Oryza meyeriana var. granulata]|uniref:Uncharacterized protein n=1 Tax=Oryza meyeriana var. granulata TaxID=110450 RepID=A0A6G1EHI7_9ORYZ|nr:hypothetical protein E2562_007717 [Oryza meyeriana var. granulata]
MAGVPRGGRVAAVQNGTLQEAATRVNVVRQRGGGTRHQHDGLAAVARGMRCGTDGGGEASLLRLGLPLSPWSFSCRPLPVVGSSMVKAAGGSGAMR